MDPSGDAVGTDGIKRTYEHIEPHVRRTPVLDLDGVTLKLEQLQHSGSFKARGANTTSLPIAQDSAG